MLTQLSRLTIETDGRYARASEVQFLKNYFKSIEIRVSAYEKIRTAETEIISKVEAKMKAMDAKLFINAAGDFTETWRKDIVQLLRYSAAALLLNEQDHLQEGLLLWHKTIAQSYQFDRTCNTTFKVMPEVMKEYLTSEEIAILIPLLALNQIALG